MSEEDFAGTRLRVGRWLPSHETTGGGLAVTGLPGEPVPDDPEEVEPTGPPASEAEVRSLASGEWPRRRWTLVAVAVSLAATLLVGAAVSQWTDRAPTAGGGFTPGARADVTSSAPGQDASSGATQPQPEPVGHVAEDSRGTAGMGDRDTGPVQAPLTAGARIGLEPVSHPGFRVRHRNFVGRIDRIGPDSGELDRADSSFVVRKGLADARCFSFESVNFPGFFLRHQDFLIRLQRFDRSGLYARDATFCAVTGLTGQQVSFRSINFPDRYLSHRGDQLRIDPLGADRVTPAAMTFAVRPALLPTPSG